MKVAKINVAAGTDKRRYIAVGFPITTILFLFFFVDKQQPDINMNSSFENYAKGDALQFMVTTSGQPLCGKNEGLGWRTRQVAGHMSDTTIQRLSQDILKLDLQRQNIVVLHSQHSNDDGDDKKDSISRSTTSDDVHLTPMSSTTPLV